MTCNKLKLNDDKTDAITVETRFRSSVSCGEHLKVGDYDIPLIFFVISLGVFLDSSLTTSKQGEQFLSQNLEGHTQEPVY